ncbi:chaplin family protein [Streptomyces sp. NPDC005388]|uniref:DUF6923 family protein n=1 Tax=Streptomyces sp. NPDC005388 TaxID=3156717 RepID=UPI0033A89C42
MSVRGRWAGAALLAVTPTTKHRLSRRSPANLLMVGGAAAAALGVLGAPQSAVAAAPDGFSCNGQIFYVATSTATNQLQLGVAGPGTVSFSPLGPAVPAYNAMGVDPATHYVFALRVRDAHLLRIDEAGHTTDVGAIAGLPGTGYFIGGFDAAGNYYVSGPDPSVLYKIDVSTRSVTGVVHLKSRLQGADITYSAGYFWMATNDGGIQRIDLGTGAVDKFASPLPAVKPGYGGAFTYGNGDLGFFNNSGFLARVHVAQPDSARPDFHLLSRQNTRPGGNVDATSCFMARADLSVTKTGPASVKAGDRVTYQITVTNHGPSDSSGWTVNDDLPAGLLNPSSPTPGCTISGDKLSCTGGRLAVGASHTITVTGTAGSGDTTMTNTATVFGNDPDPNPGNNTSSVHTAVGVPGGATGSPGILTGNAVRTPIHAPVNLCGNTIDIIGVLNPAFGNTCANT